MMKKMLPVAFHTSKEHIVDVDLNMSHEFTLSHYCDFIQRLELQWVIEFILLFLFTLQAFPIRSLMERKLKSHPAFNSQLVKLSSLDNRSINDFLVLSQIKIA